jgi:tetratricopeptide (TPR) repeat protein
MKAERRHELKTNSLSKGLENAPAFFQQYGSRILLGVIVCLLAYILVQNHLRDKADKAKNVAKALGGALYSLNELRHIPTQTAQGQLIPAEQLAALRKEHARDVESSVSEVIANSDDPKVLAQAWVVRGDLNWQLANFPSLPGAATRPELNTDKPSDEYLSAAADAYGKVLQPPLNEDRESVTAARLSLANIAENRGQWDKAKEYFQQVADDSAAGKGFQDWAKICLDDLKAVEKPAFVGSGTAQIPARIPGNPIEFGPALPSNISTLPSTTLPATMPATAPSTQPSVSGLPSTQPSIFSPPTSDPLRLK